MSLNPSDITSPIIGTVVLCSALILLVAVTVVFCLLDVDSKLSSMRSVQNRAITYFENEERRRNKKKEIKKLDAGTFNLRLRLAAQEVPELNPVDVRKIRQCLFELLEQTAKSCFIDTGVFATCCRQINVYINDCNEGVWEELAQYAKANSTKVPELKSYIDTFIAHSGIDMTKKTPEPNSCLGVHKPGEPAKC